MPTAKLPPRLDVPIPPCLDGTRAHYWDIIDRVGTCRYCKEVHTFLPRFRYSEAGAIATHRQGGKKSCSVA